MTTATGGDFFDGWRNAWRHALRQPLTTGGGALLRGATPPVVVEGSRVTGANVPRTGLETFPSLPWGWGASTAPRGLSDLGRALSIRRDSAGAAIPNPKTEREAVMADDRCRECNGTGECAACEGTGAKGFRKRCAECDGSGKCDRCHGKGRGDGR